MNKQIITFTANEQSLVRVGGECHYSSNKVSYVEAHFGLGDNWSGYDSVRAVWFTDFVKGISTVLDGEGNCTVPTEVLKKKDRVFVNLVGSIVSNGELTDRLTTYPAVALVVDSKAKVDSTETAPVTPSQFEQFVSIVQDAVANIKDIVSTTLNADYTLTFVYSDGTSYTTPSIRGERGPQGADGADGTDGNGIASAVLNSNYTLTLTFTDGTSYTTPSIRGAQGPKGDPGDVSQAQLDAAVSDLKSALNEVRDATLSDVTDVYSHTTAITSGGRLGNTTPVITISIPTGTPYKFKLTDSIGAFTNYTLYENEADNTRASVGYYAVNTEVSLIAGRNIAYLSIYPNSTHQASGNIIAQVSIDKYNKDSLQVQVEALNKKADAFNIGYSDVNLIDASKALENKYISTGGQVATTSNLYATDFCEISDDKPFYVQYAYNGYYAYYNENKECIQYYGLNQGEISDPQDITQLTPPSGAKYVRFSVYYTRINDAWLNVRNTYPTGAIIWNVEGQVGSRCDYRGNDMCVFSKGLCIGDSLTEGTYNYNEGGTTQYGTFKNGAVLHDYSYPKKLSQMLGIDITNHGIGGQTSAEWWALMSTVDFSGHDFAIIQFGVNDVSRYGTWGDTSKNAYDAIINKLKADNPNIKIYVATIIPSTVYTGTAYDNFSEAIRTYVASLNDANVILADIAQYGHTGDSNAFNAGHLSAYGYWRLAQDYKNLISYLIYTNQMQYRQVQFIGTTHSFS